MENTEPERRVVTFQEKEVDSQETEDLRKDVDNLLDTVSRLEVRLEGLKKYGKGMNSILYYRASPVINLFIKYHRN